LALALDAVVARLALISAGAAVVRIGFQADALLIAAGIGEAAARAASTFLLFQFPGTETAELAAREPRRIAEPMPVEEPLAVAEARDHDLPGLLLALVAVANLSRCRLGKPRPNRATGDRGQHSTDDAFEHLTARRGSTEHARQIVKPSLFHRMKLLRLRSSYPTQHPSGLSQQIVPESQQ